jgi:type IV pilus assembly protein PilQ
MISMTRCFREENRKVIVNSRWLLVLCGIVVWFGSTWAQAQTAIRAVSTSNVDGFELVRVEADGPINAVPASFTLQKPARISLDFNGFVNQTGRNVVEVSQSALRSINILEASGRTRLVLNLNRPVKYDIELRGNIAEIRLDNTSFHGVSGSPSAGRATTFSSQLSDVSPASLNDVDFRRGEDGSGRVMVELSDPQTAVDIRQLGQNLVVEFLRTTLPEGLRRRLNVADFGTPVRMVTATQVGDRVRLLVEPTGDWEHSAYQSDNRFVLEVRPVKADANKLVQGPKYSGEKLSLNFQNIDVRALLQVIADFTNFNIITTDTVQGNLTLRLKDVPWDQALDIILESKALGMTRTGNVIRVAPKKELDAEAVAQREVNKKLEELEPLRTEVFRLNFAKAEEVANTLKDATATGGGENQTTNRILSPRGSAIADVRTNQVFVTDVAGRLEAVRDYIRRVDSPKRQVMIQARIVEAREGFSKSLGVRLGGADLRTIRGGDAGYSVGGGARVAVGGSYDAITSTTGQTANLMTNPNTSFVNLPARSDAVQDIPRLALSLFSPAANRFLNLELSALESDNKGRIISSPRVVTGDLSKSKIKQGDQLKLILPGGTNGAPRVETVDANLQLDVEPQITPSGKVLLKLNITKNRVLSLTTAGASLAVKEVNTEVMVDNGGTVMIGGIFEQEETEGVDKVPVLGDVPVLGHLFKTRNTNTAKTETLIFITPVILEDGAVTP